MTVNFDLIRKAPFKLDDAAAGWVQDTLKGMTTDEKIGQLFCTVLYSDDTKHISALNTAYHMGGFLGRAMPLKDACRTVAAAQGGAKIPLLVAANFEAGGDGFVTDGTNVGPNMMIAAAGDPALAGRQAYVCAREGLAAGANFALAPVIDIDINFRNPITNTRTYGADPAFVRDAGVSFVKTAQEMGMAACVKHFPGDGVDERDQHLVTSVNSLSCEAWDRTYGQCYKASVDAGVLAVMAGHIMLPAYSKKLDPALRDEDIMPATLSKELLGGLLRERLGFNGLIITDASTMAGMCIPLPREKAVPWAIAAGCDMFLFTRNLDEDYGYMHKGVRDGVISPERLDEAVLRILALKAAIGLHKKQETGGLIPNPDIAAEIVGCREHREIEKACVRQSVTLVKNLEGILPLSPEKYGRVLLYPISSGESFFWGGGEDLEQSVRAALEAEGFAVTVFEPSKGFEGLTAPYRDIADNYDLIIYAANLKTQSNQTTVRIEWQQPMGANCPIYIPSVPTVFISFANPYHLLDVPRIKTFINAYHFKAETLNAVISKLLGRDAFTGSSPVDAFCGFWDSRL